MSFYTKFLLAAIISGALLAYNNCSKVEFAQPVAPEKPEALALPPETAADLCRTKVRQIKRNIALNFPQPTRGCDWGANGNLSEVDARNQARLEQHVEFSELQLPANATVCGISFSFNQSDFKFDDHFFLNLDNIVLATSNSQLLAYMEKVTEWGYSKYNWEAIKGKPSDNGVNHNYCYGQDRLGPTGAPLATCSWPTTQQIGPLVLSLDPSLIQQVADYSLGSNHRFTLVTTGDNDNRTDCQHSGANFSLDVEYAVE